MRNVVIRKKCNVVIVFANFLVFLCAITILTFLTYGLIEEPDMLGDFWFIIIALFVLLLKATDTIGWNIFGKEIMQMNDEKLIIQRKGKLFSFQTSLHWFEIEKIETKQYNATFWDFYVMILRGYYRRGTLKFCYSGRSIYFGQDLSVDDAEKIKSKLDTYLLPSMA